LFVRTGQYQYWCGREDLNLDTFWYMHLFQFRHNGFLLLFTYTRTSFRPY